MIRLRAWRPRPGRACSIALAFLVAGCASVSSDREPVPGVDVARPLPPGQGSLNAQKGRPGHVIGAPHGTTDAGTDLIGLDLARRTGFGVAVGRGFGKLDAEGRRYTGNRPTESVAGAPPRTETETPAARRVYEAYDRTVAEASQGPLRLYVEIHGNAHEDTAGRVEIATVGLDRAAAWQVKTLLELIRDSYLRGHPETPRLEIFLEPVDTLRYSAGASKSGGMLGRSEKSLHVELPRVARTSARDAYTAMLGEFLVQWADLLAAARKN